MQNRMVRAGQAAQRMVAPKVKAKASTRRCESCNAVLRSGNLTKHCSPCTYKINNDRIRNGMGVPKGFHKRDTE